MPEAPGRDRSMVMASSIQIRGAGLKHDDGKQHHHNGHPTTAKAKSWAMPMPRQRPRTRSTTVIRSKNDETTAISSFRQCA
jgi:hypothetical protein